MKYLIFIFSLLFFLTGCEEWNKLFGKTDDNHSFACQSNFQYPTVQIELPNISHTHEKFNSCREMKDYISAQQTIYNVEHEKLNNYLQTLPQNSCWASIAQPVNSEIGSVQQPTNIQTSSVDEADIVKRSENYIFAVTPTHLEVMDIETLKLQQRLPLEHLKNVKLYYHNDTLVVFGSPGIQTMILSEPYQTVEFYHVKNKVIKLGSFSLSGSLMSSRLQDDGTLTFITQSPTSFHTPDSPSIQGKGMDCTNIYKPIVEDFSTQITHIYSFPISKKVKKIKSSQTSILGSYDNVYMSEKNLYLYQNGIQWLYWDQRQTNLQNQSFIAQFQRKNNNWDLHSSGEIQGDIANSWALKEIDSNLAIATTTRPIWDEGITVLQSNFLTILNTENPEMEELSMLGPFADGETIRSVRYINDMAYVVTFRQVDPLFAIDLSQLENPKILNELKVPGFSNYLHPISEKYLLGFGQSINETGSFLGLQLSLFDIENPTDLKAIAQKTVGNSSSFSDALYDHTAFFYSPTYSLMGFPIVSYLNYSALFSGALIYKVNENGFTLKSKLSHSNWLFKNCSVDSDQPEIYYSDSTSLDINRIFEIDERLFSLSRFGIQEHNPENPVETIRELEFPNSDFICPLGSFAY